MSLTLTQQDYADLAWSTIAPAATADLWEWCSTHSRLPNGRRWQSERALLLRYWYRVISARLSRRPLAGHPTAHLAEEIWLILGAQLFKSTLLNQVTTSVIHHHPRKTAYFMTRSRDFKAVQKGKLRPMIEKTPELNALLPQSALAREHALAADIWMIGGTAIYWQQGSVADDYRREDYELIIDDEIDKFPKDVEGEGDPITLQRTRGRTHPHSFLILGASTPTKVDGIAWQSLCDGTHERPLVILPCCGYANALDPERVLLAEGATWADTRPADILDHRLGRYACPGCGTLITERELRRAIVDCANHDRWCSGTWKQSPDHPAGLWTPHAPRNADGQLTGPIPPPQGRILSGQACSLYSPLVSLHKFASEKCRAERGSRLRRVAFTNTDCALPVIETTITTTTEAITAATAPAEPYTSGRLPWSADWLILFFDQQGNTRDKYWWPWVLRALARPTAAGERPRSWLIAAGAARTPAERDQVESTVWNVGGRSRPADTIAMDSANGNAKADIYLWAADRPTNRVLLYGDSRLAPGVLWQQIEDGPAVRKRTPKPQGVLEYKIQPHRWRDRLWECIQGHSDAPLHWYLPTDPDPRYLRSLTSEEQATELRRVTGVGLREDVIWRPRATREVDGSTTYRTDTHWWDGEANLLALADIIGLLAPHEDTPPPADPTDTPAGDDWMGGYTGDTW